MIRIYSTILALAIYAGACLFAGATSVTLTGAGVATTTPPPAATITFTDNAVDTAGGSTITWTGRAIGTATATRQVIVTLISYNISAASNGASMTVGGISATKLIDVGGAVADNLYAAVFIANVPTGTTATIVASFTTTPSRAGIGVYAADNLVSTTPTNTYTSTGTANPFSQSVNISAGGFGVAVSSKSDNSTAGTYTWAGLTERYDQTINFSITHSGASLAFAAAQTGLTVSSTYSLTPSTVQGAYIVAAFR